MGGKRKRPRGVGGRFVARAALGAAAPSPSVGKKHHLSPGPSARKKSHAHENVVSVNDEAPAGPSANVISFNSEPAGPPAGPSGEGSSLAALVEAMPSFYLAPRSFFVAWNGVLTLAFSGFPSVVLKLKRDIEQTFRSVCKENPGSLWPKVTLGVVRDGARLTPVQYAALCRVCEQATAAMVGEAGGRGYLVSHCSLVIHEQRSLEATLSETLLLLRGGFAVFEGPDPESTRRVDAVLGEAESEDYWVRVSGDGNRESHYRSPAFGVTLAHMLRPRGSHAMPPRVGTMLGSGPSPRATGLPDDHWLARGISRFRRCVEQALPGVYAFFPDHALHVTLRALQ